VCAGKPLCLKRAHEGRPIARTAMPTREEISMRCFVMTLFAACAALSVAGQTLAQAPTPGAPTAAPAAPAAVPDQMPFDIPYGPAIAADRAAKVVAAAVEEAKKSPRNWDPRVAVGDPNGDLVYFYKMDQTQVASINIAQGKARTAARFRRPSGAFFNLMQPPPGPCASPLDPTLVASHGGFPLVEGGKIIGAIGCSGATGDQDGV